MLSCVPSSCTVTYYILTDSHRALHFILVLLRNRPMGLLVQWQELRILDPPPALRTTALHCCPTHLPSPSQAKDFSLCWKPFNNDWMQSILVVGV